MGITGASAGSLTINVNVVTTTEMVVEYTAGETILAKSAVCVGESDSKIYNTKADSLTTMPAIGIVKSDVDINETALVYQTGKVTSVRREADFSPDDLVFVSPDTLGKVTKTPPETLGQFVQTLGRAINASDMVLEVGPLVEIGS